jgi:hypothetical protein
MFERHPSEDGCEVCEWLYFACCMAIVAVGIFLW